MTDPTDDSDGQPQDKNRRVLALVALAVAAWGLLLAAGAYFQPGADHPVRDPRRFWIVLGCVALFLAFWGLALWVRRRRG
jgi:type VI protein secretion system component VasK